MERKFLEELGIEKDIIDKVLNQHSSEIGKYKQSAKKVAAENPRCTSVCGKAAPTAFINPNRPSGAMKMSCTPRFLRPLGTLSQYLADSIST